MALDLNDLGSTGQGRISKMRDGALASQNDGNVRRSEFGIMDLVSKCSLVLFSTVTVLLVNVSIETSQKPFSLSRHSVVSGLFHWISTRRLSMMHLATICPNSLWPEQVAMSEMDHNQATIGNNMQ